jgi:2,3-bisphosphoglycerate-dependent phosphoglycerate mutase
MPSLILLRNGQSTWNLENKFTGNVDVDLTKLGEKETMLASILLENYIIDVVYTSVLKRAVLTLAII